MKEDQNLQKKRDRSKENEEVAIEDKKIVKKGCI
jgi:hypothetical protein